MKVLQFLDSIGRGGKERMLVELVRGLTRHHDVQVEIVVMSREIQYPEIHDLDVTLHYLIRRTRKDPFIVPQLQRVCRQFNPDVIHVWDTMSAVYAVPVSMFLRIPLVNGMISNAPEHIRMGSDLWLRSRLTFPFSASILANSLAGLRSYGVRSSKGICIYNGFDSQRSGQLEDPHAVRARLGIRTPKIVGMVGEFAARKDFDTFISAAQTVLAERTDVTFIAVGDGPDWERCKKLVRAENRDRILFPGWQEKVESVINIFDIGVLSTFTEGISNSILEYMALKKPVIASSGGGTPEIVIDGVTGYLISTRRADELVKHIHYLLDNPVESRKMGCRGEEEVRKKFSIDLMITKHIDLYKNPYTKHHFS